MFEATLAQGQALKQILEAIKDLVNEVNLECCASGIHLRAMDPSHVSVVTLQLRANGFESYRCDRNVSLGIDLASAANKLLEFSGDDGDSITLRCQDGADSVTFLNCKQRKGNGLGLPAAADRQRGVGVAVLPRTAPPGGGPPSQR
eukprot:TRINITY_DN26106_c0_g1_i1.p2 TRINITY_DN26106_c0_g1~~TRINITY_DN26106_c0_g1_i1.p2  ORF type:complete len:146 (-),score=24.29 TRINITY_DN26106_c0_g1_i1:61-498(-)